MGYHIYLVDHKKKVLVDCGNVPESVFEEDYKIFKNVLEVFHEGIIEFPELESVKVKNLTLRDLSCLVKCAEILQALSNISSRWLALAYRYYSEDNLNVIGEVSLPDYRGYKIL